MKTFKKLAEKIKQDLGFELTNFKRTYAGKHQKGSGGFVWTAEDKNSKESVGSCKTATELLKGSKIECLKPTLSSLREFI